jgi:hypothetical protein
MRFDPPVPFRTYHDMLRQFLHAHRGAGRADGDHQHEAADPGQPGWSTCWAAATARPTCCPTSPGTCSANGPTGWARVQAICDFVHRHIEFGYPHAARTRTAWEAYNEGKRRLPRLCAPGGRALPLHEHPGALLHRLPRRHRHPPPWGTMDFAGWIEVYLGDRWYTFDARNNTPRIGRILMARGRDATDVAMVTSFGPCTLSGFTVFTDEVA